MSFYNVAKPVVPKEPCTAVLNLLPSVPLLNYTKLGLPVARESVFSNESKPVLPSVHQAPLAIAQNAVLQNAQQQNLSNAPQLVAIILHNNSKSLHLRI